MDVVAEVVEAVNEYAILTHDDACNTGDACVCQMVVAVAVVVALVVKLLARAQL